MSTQFHSAWGLYINICISCIQLCNVASAIHTVFFLNSNVNWIDINRLSVAFFQGTFNSAILRCAAMINIHLVGQTRNHPKHTHYLGQPHRAHAVRQMPIIVLTTSPSAVENCARVMCERLDLAHLYTIYMLSHICTQRVVLPSSASLVAAVVGDDGVVHRQQSHCPEVCKYLAYPIESVLTTRMLVHPQPTPTPLPSVANSHTAIAM